MRVNVKVRVKVRVRVTVRVRNIECESWVLVGMSET